jgi:hypothetical protein
MKAPFSIPAVVALFIVGCSQPGFVTDPAGDPAVTTLGKNHVPAFQNGRFEIDQTVQATESAKQSGLMYHVVGTLDFESTRDQETNTLTTLAEITVSQVKSTQSVSFSEFRTRELSNDAPEWIEKYTLEDLQDGAELHVEFETGGIIQLRSISVVVGVQIAR